MGGFSFSMSKWPQAQRAVINLNGTRSKRPTWQTSTIIAETSTPEAFRTSATESVISLRRKRFRR
jgi:hypothetical protein